MTIKYSLYLSDVSIRYMVVIVTGHHQSHSPS